MIPMLQLLALVLTIVVPPSSLSPEAGEHNTQAMRHYDAGQWAPAVDEFYAALRASGTVAGPAPQPAER